MDTVPLIELRGVTCFRGGNEALHEIDLSLAAGETLFAMGWAGSGKSALVKTAAGIALPDEGEVLFKGRSLARMSEREEAVFRRASGFVFQDAALWANKSLFENLALPVRVHEPRWDRAQVEAAVRRAVELVGYSQGLNVRPAELSSGEKKLIGLARALVLDPELLFMDDPTSGLDEASAARVPAIVDELKARGRALIVASASSDFASRCADSVAVLRGGAIAAYGSYAEAAAWSDSAVREVTGRLKSRAAGPTWATGLTGAWVSALAGEGGASGPSPTSKDNIIDRSLPGEDGRDGDERDKT